MQNEHNRCIAKFEFAGNCNCGGFAIAENKRIEYIPAKPPKREKRVGIYCRVSTNSADQLKSLTAQISALMRVTSVNPKRFLDAAAWAYVETGLPLQLINIEVVYNEGLDGYDYEVTYKLSSTEDSDDEGIITNGTLVVELNKY